MPDTREYWHVCKAKRSDGQPCRSPAIRGGRVCRIHGGSTRHIREAANKRIEELVLPSISKLRTLMLRGESHAIQLKAAESILDRAGIVAEKHETADTQVNIVVSYADVELARNVLEQSGNTFEVRYAELPEGPQANGHASEP